jgi:hypothetical protein
MPRTEISIDGNLLEELSEAFAYEDPKARQDFARAYAEAERRGIIPYMVARVKGLSIKIWADEHPPPHFHVDYQGQGASFSILTCERLAGVTGLERYDRTINRWWQRNQALLIETWNMSRPADCPVGPILAPEISA